MVKTDFLDNKNLLKILPFYNVLVDFMQQPEVKKLTNIELLNELPLYNSLGVKNVSEAFTRYAKSFNIEIIDKKDTYVQLYLSKLCIKGLLKVLLCEMKGFKYVITINATLCKRNTDDNVEYASAYFNSFIKSVINYKFEHLIDKSIEEILYRIDDWINEGSGWIVDKVNSKYLNISKYAPLLGSSFIKLPDKLNHPKKGLINIQNDDNKCFLWCHFRHLDLVGSNSARISEKDREIADALDYSDVALPVSEKDYKKIN